MYQEEVQRRNAWKSSKYAEKCVFSIIVSRNSFKTQITKLLETQLSEKGYASERILSQGKDWNDDLTEARQMQGGFEMKMA